MASRQALRGLDWLLFFVADLQTGFGPFIAVYLTHSQWTQAEIGLALGVGSTAAMLAQVPAGVLVDAMRGKAVAAAVALAGIATAALLMASSPTFWPVALAQVMHGFSSCMLGPALSALTLGLVSTAPSPSVWAGMRASRRSEGQWVPRSMGACGTWVSARAVFWLARVPVYSRPARITIGWGGAPVIRDAGDARGARVDS